MATLPSLPKLPDLNVLVGDIKDAASGVLKKDVATIRGFAETQVSMLAQQTLFVARAEAEGEFKDNPTLRDFFLSNLEDLAKDFANTLKGLVQITIEKVWNAIVNVLWTTIEKAAGIALARPI